MRHVVELSHPLVGRDRERALLRQLVGATHLRGHALIVEGEVGVGKSAMVACGAALAAEAGFHEVRCVSAPGGSTHTFSGLRTLLRPVQHRADTLPAKQRRALLAALGLADGPPPDPLLLNLAVLGVLEDAAHEQPLLVVAEDVQWLDPATADMLGFVARRLTRAPLLMLGTCRPGPACPLRPFKLPHLALGALSRSESGRLLDSRNGSLRPALRERVLDVASGSPLVLLELEAAMRAPDFIGAALPPPQMPATPRLVEAWRSLVGALPAPSRRLLLLAAADPDATLTELVAAGARMGSGLGALSPLQDQGLVVVTADRLLFRDPLVRSAVYAGAGSRERMAVHRALAAVTNDAGRAARHRVAAAAEGEDDVSSEPTMTRTRNQALRAAAVAEVARQAGMTAEMTDLIDYALPLATDPGVLADLLTTQTMSAMTAGGPGRTSSNLLLLARGILAAGTDTSAKHALASLDVLFLAALVSRAVSTSSGVREDIAHELRTVDMLRAHPRWLMATALLDPSGALPSLRADLAGVVHKGNPSTASLFGLGLAAEALQDLGTATHVWELAVDRLGRASPGADLANAVMHRGRLRVVTGRLDEALVDLDRVERSTADLNIPLVRAAAAACAAHIHVWRGDATAALAAVRRTGQPAGTEPHNAITADVSWAVGLGALAERRFGDAWNALNSVSIHPVAALWAIGDLAEAAVGAGGVGVGVARDLVQDAERDASRSGSSHLLSLVHRAYAVLGGGDNVADHFERSLAAAGPAASPLDVARTQLLYGMWLRRRHRIVAAREQLRDALVGLDAAGARPWATQAVAELRAAGVAPMPVEQSQRMPRPALTAQELTIARLAAAGMTNRQIADRVFLSHRTVGANLYRTFPKLGVTTRSHLGRALALSGFDEQEPSGVA